jgi:aspartate/methionine/tyrosine aminotransferase
VDHRLARRVADIEPFRVVEMMQEAWRLEDAGRDIVFMVAGEPDFGTPAPVIEAVSRRLVGGHVHYTPSLGLPELRSAIADYYRSRFGLVLPVERIAVTTGASGALLLALAATVEPDTRILLADPGYPCNRHFMRLYEGRARSISVDAATNYQLTAAHVDEHWNDDTTGVLVATPSNPTGTIVAPEELAAIAATVAARAGVLYVDEIYGELVYDAPTTSILSRTDDAFVVNSFSKTFGMTGWRLGWLVMPEWAVDAIEVLAQNLYISPPAPSQWAGHACLDPEVWTIVGERREELRRRRDRLIAGLRALGFGIPVVPQGAFYVYADCSAFGDDSAAFARRLLHEAGVAVTPGNDFGTYRAQHHLRFSYTTSITRIEEALERMTVLLA